MSDPIVLNVQNVIKNMLTPYVLRLIEDVNKYLISNRFPFLLVVVGGDALSKHFPKDKALESHDFDVRLAPIIGNENRPGLKELQYRLSKLIAVYFEQNLNKYMYDNISSIKQTLTRKFGNTLEGFKINNGKIFVASKSVVIDNKFQNVPVETPTGNKRMGDLFTLLYTLKINNVYITDSLIDIFAARPSTVDHYYDNVNEGNTNNPRTFIPYVMYDKVPYASLGFLIWDTLRLIEKGKKLNYSKLPRYVMKYNQILRNLYHPEQNLSCMIMKDLVNKCK